MSNDERSRFRPFLSGELAWRASDTLPSLVVQVVDDDGDPVDLTGARAWFSTRRLSGVVDESWEWGPGIEVLIANPAEGILYYDMQPGDTDTNPGLFELTAIIKFADGTELTVPTNESAELTIRDAPDRIVGSPAPFGGLGLNRG